MKPVRLGFHEWLAKFVILNVMWLICNAPVLLLLLMFFTGGMSGLLAQGIIVGFLLSVTVFFPVTTALFCSTRDLVMKRETSSAVKSYLNYIKVNVKQSVMGGSVLSTSYFMWGFLYTATDTSVLLRFFLFGTLIPLLLLTIYFFVVISHFAIPFNQVIRKSLLLTFGNMKLSLFILTVTFIVFYVSVNGFYFLALFFSASITAFMIFSMFYRTYVDEATV